MQNQSNSVNPDENSSAQEIETPENQLNIALVFVEQDPI